MQANGPLRLTWEEVIGRRLARHHLLRPASAGALTEVASDICGIHAQMAPSSELMLGLRLARITRQDVRTALWETRTLVKTVGLRGTLHLLPAGEVPMWMAANRLRFAAEERRRRGQGVDMDGFFEVVEAISDMVGPEPLTRPQLEQELERRVGAWAVTRNQGWVGTYANWPMAVGWAAALGRVCYGPGQGGRSTFVRLTDWSSWREEDPFQAGLWVVRRFLRAYGPATVAEFARWFALEPPQARQLFAALEAELEAVEVDGEKRWMLAGDGDGFEPAPASVHLLPHFDVYVVGSHPRRQLIPPGTAIGQAVSGTAAGLPVVLVGGRVMGVWVREPKGKRLRIAVDVHTSLTRRQREAIAEQAERVGEILELESELEFTSLPLRFHL
jgi:Winged helix DNA-binding domain